MAGGEAEEEGEEGSGYGEEGDAFKLDGVGRLSGVYIVLSKSLIGY